MKKRSRVRIFTAFIVLAICTLSTPAFADSPKVTDAEKAVLTFFKLSGTTPDYKKWIAASKNYQDMAAEPGFGKHLALYAEQEDLRLKWGYGTLDLNTNALKIKTDIVMSLTESAKGDKLNFSFMNSSREEVPYFPFPYGEEWIALVVNDLNNFTSVTLTPEQSTHVRQYFKVGEIYQGSIKIRARGVSADAKAPLPLDGSNYWLMLGETGYIAFSYKPDDAEKSVVVWDYTAPWYLTHTEEMLQPLIAQP